LKTLILNQVNKAYQDVHAVKDLSLQVEQGKIFGLLGPNGAGKSTTIRMVMDILRPDSGTIELMGKSNTDSQLDIIGYLPEERGLYKKMPVIDIIKFFAELKGISAKESESVGRKWLERLELDEWADKKLEELSRGMQQKLQFICTIIHKPKLIILDEPFTGLDPVNTNVLKDVMLELKQQGTSIIFSTHLMEQVEKLCDAICLINKGEAVLKGQLSEIKAGYGKNRIKLAYDGDSSFLKDETLVASFDDYGQYVEIQPAAGVSSQQILKTAANLATIQHFEVSEPSLNEIFINVVQKGGQA